MREVISIHMGQCGVQIGTTLWELYCLEHGLDQCGERIESSADQPQGPSGDGEFNSELFSTHLSITDGEWSRIEGAPIQEGFKSFFSENSTGTYSPRALLIDLEPTVIDEVRNGSQRHLFQYENLINGKEDAANNYARGYFTSGRTIITRVLSSLRKIAENCDKLEGFMVVHSFGGGTGSGFHSLLTENVVSSFGNRKMMEITVFPSPKYSTAVVEPYNAVLATNATISLAQCVFLADNEAMYNICQNRLEIDCPSYKNLNQLLAQTASSITASLRFKGTLNADFADFQTNLVPFPRIHFPIMSYAPIYSPKYACHQTMSVAEITSKVFDSTNRLCEINTDRGEYISCCLLYRGDVMPKDVNKGLMDARAKKNVNFVHWSPTGFKIGINNNQPSFFDEGDMAPSQRAVCMIANTTAIQQSWHDLNIKYHQMLRKRAFLHWYTGEGMDFQEFCDAQENLLILEHEYGTL